MDKFIRIKLFFYQNYLELVRPTAGWKNTLRQ